MLAVLLFTLFTISLADPSHAPPMPGGWTAQNANDQEYTDLAWETATSAVNRDASTANTNMAYVPMKVLSAKTQVVAGLNTELEIEFGESSCTKDSSEITQTACSVSANSPTKVYRVRIFSQPWTNTLKVTSVQEIQKPN